MYLLKTIFFSKIWISLGTEGVVIIGKLKCNVANTRREFEPDNYKITCN